MSNSISITWYGHSYFLMELGNTRIAIDPHDGGSLNLPEFRIQADAVLITHNHYDHNAVEMVDAKRVVKWRRGNFTIGSFKVLGIGSYHDKASGTIRGENTIYIINFNNIRIAHLGDLGHLPDESFTKLLDGVEILMIPVGGVYTINAEEAWEIIKILNPKLVIPMHFWLPYSTLPLDPIDRFLSIAKARRLRVTGNKITFSIDEIPEKSTIVVMQPP